MGQLSSRRRLGDVDEVDEALVNSAAVPEARYNGNKLSDVRSSVKQEDNILASKDCLDGRVLCRSDGRDVSIKVRRGGEAERGVHFQELTEIVDLAQRNTGLKNVSITRIRHFV